MTALVSEQCEQGEAAAAPLAGAVVVLAWAVVAAVGGVVAEGGDSAYV
jgi:hypothetical protein